MEIFRKNWLIKQKQAANIVLYSAQILDVVADVMFMVIIVGEAVGVCLKIRWPLVNGRVGRLDQRVQGVYPAVRRAGRLRLCLQDTRMQLG